MVGLLVRSLCGRRGWAVAGVIQKRVMSDSGSMKDAGIKVCCTSGTPHAGNYTGRGEVIQLSTGVRAYQTGKGGSRGVVLIYDIFGFDIGNTRRFADELAASGSGLNVVMPDIFRGKPWKLEDFPPKRFEDLMEWLERTGTWDIVHKDIKLVEPVLRQSGAKGPLGIVGFCWGGKMALQACSGPEFGAGVAVHGAWLGPEDATRVRCPMMFLPAGDDPAIDPVKAELDKKPFGSRCQYKVFKDQIHGFAAARGDWNDKATLAAATEAIQLTRGFLVNNLS